MAKKRKAKEQEEPQGTGTAPAAEGKPKRGRKAKGTAPHKPPADPFGDVLPRAKEQGSPADGTWQPTSDPVTDISALESQERFLFKLMTRAKAQSDVAKAEAKLVMAQAQETSVMDGFSVEEAISLHKQADTAERKAAKLLKEYKRSREGWNATQGMLHRYLTGADDHPLFDAKKKGKAA